MSDTNQELQKDRPHSDYLEENLIGAVLIKGRVEESLSKVLPQTFRQFHLRPIWKAILDLKEKGDPIDIEIVAHVLDVEGELEKIGGPAELTRLIANCPNAYYDEAYASQVLNAAADRSLIYLADQIAKLAGKEGDSFEKFERAESIIHKFKSRVAPTSPADLLSADDILRTAWPEPVWAIPEIAPTGLTIVAGKSKLGKSWLMLQIAQAVAAGGVVFERKVEPRSVLYPALEDPPRRLQERMIAQHWPFALPAQFITLGQFHSSIGDLRDGGGPRLAAQIADQHYGLVVIDTLSRSVQGDQSDVEAMTRALEPIQEIAHRTNAAIFLVDHHNKLRVSNPDAILDILGSTAKGAVSDTVWGLYRERGKVGAKLQVTGRDILEKTLALTWSPQTYCWHYEGDADEIELTERRSEILDALDQLGRAQVGDIADAIGQDRGNTFRRIQDLIKAGLIRRMAEGHKVFYELPGETGTTVTTNNNDKEVV